MATINAFFIARRPRSRFQRLAIQWTLPRGRWWVNQAYWGVLLESTYFDVPERDLRLFSSRFHTDVYWLSYQSAADSFRFCHWRDGQLIRLLVYGCDNDRIWEKVEGEREAWETEYFFCDEDLADQLRWAETEEEQIQARALWSKQELQPGEYRPIIDAEATAFHIARHHGFPGWNFAEGSLSDPEDALEKGSWLTMVLVIARHLYPVDAFGMAVAIAYCLLCWGLLLSGFVGSYPGVRLWLLLPAGLIIMSFGFYIAALARRRRRVMPLATLLAVGFWVLWLRASS